MIGARQNKLHERLFSRLSKTSFSTAANDIQIIHNHFASLLCLCSSAVWDCETVRIGFRLFHNKIVFSFARSFFFCLLADDGGSNSHFARDIESRFAYNL